MLIESPGARTIRTLPARLAITSRQQERGLATWIRQRFKKPSGGGDQHYFARQCTRHRLGVDGSQLGQGHALGDVHA
jgi:hypothetical protein